MLTSDTQAEPRKAPNKCGRCGATPRLAHKILSVRTGGTLRMYKCECGERTWLDHPAE